MALLSEFREKYKDVFLATPENNEEILHFFATISIDAEALQLRYVREPDFFTFTVQQGLPSATFLFRNKDGSLGGVAVITSRSSWVNGHLVPTGYNSDLRISPKLSRRTRLQWRRIYGSIVDRYQDFEDLGFPQYFYAVIIEGNHDAIRALLKPKANPAYHKMADFNSINIFGQVCTPVCKGLNRKRIGASGYDFSWATEADHDDVKQFLYLENKDKQFGTGYTKLEDGELERRYATWTDFSIKSFVVARKNGALVGCFAPWSNGVNRRILIEKAPLPLRVLGGVMPLFGEKSIRVNSELKTLYLTSLELDSGMSQSARSKLLGLMVDYLFLDEIVKDYNLVTIFNSANCCFNDCIKGRGYLYTTQNATLYQVLPAREVEAQRFLTVGENEIMGFELATA